MEVFIVTFIILTIAHPISDFIVRNFTWNRWYCDLLHYLIALNPLHFLWDMFLLGTFHGKYSTEFQSVASYQIKHYHLLASDTSFQKFDDPQKIDIIEHRFWLWLGIDQLAHQLLNLLLATFMEVIF